MGAIDALVSALRGDDTPEWQKGDPRYQFQRGQALPSHVEAVPKFATEAEAQAWSQQHLNTPLSFGTDVEQRFPGQYPSSPANTAAFQRVADPLSRAYQAGVRFPPSLYVQSEKENGDFHPRTVMSGYLLKKDGSIHLNGTLANERPSTVDATVLHELGHRNDESATTRGYWTDPMQPGSAREVGDYAATSPAEFIAEAYAQQSLGKKLSPNAAELYAAQKGPTPPRLPPKNMNYDDAVQQAAMAIMLRRLNAIFAKNKKE